MSAYDIFQTQKQVCPRSHGKRAALPHLSLHASPAQCACSSKNSASSNLAAVQWEFPIVKSPYWLQWGALYIPPKLPLPVDRSSNTTTCLIRGPVRPTMTNNIRIQSAVFPQCTGQTDPLRDRWLMGMVCNYRPLSLYRQQRSLITDNLFGQNILPTMQHKNTLITLTRKGCGVLRSVCACVCV